MGFMDSLKGIIRAKPGVSLLPKEGLLTKLLDLNREDLPFKVEKGGDIDLLAQWKIVDLHGMRFLPRQTWRKSTKSGFHLMKIKRP